MTQAARAGQRQSARVKSRQGRKPAIEALTEAERRLRTVVTGAPVVLFALDRQGVFTLVEGKALDALGVTPDEVVGRSITDVYRNLPDLQQEMSRALAGEELTSIARIGAVILEYRVSPFRDQGGRVAGAIGVGTDITERKRVEDALRESGQRLEAVIEASPLAVCAIDLQANVLMWNSAAERLFGWSQDEIVGEPYPLVPPDRADEFRRLREQFFGGIGFTGLESRRRKKDGAEVDVSISTAPLRDAAGQIIGGVAILEDISERKRAQEALRQSEERYRDLVENLSEVIYALDKDGRVTYVSPAVERLGGYSPSELIGRSFAEFIHPEDLPPLVQSFQKTISGDMEPSEYRVLDKSGEVRWVRTSSRPVFDGDRIVGLRAVLMDITDRKRAEEALRASEERYRELFENASDIVYTMDLNGRLTSINQAGERIIGYSREEALSVYVAEFVPPEYHASAAEAIKGRFAGDGPTTYELEVVAKDGHRVPLEVSPRLVYKDGQPVGIQAIARDISERKRAEEALRASEEGYRELVENANDLVYTHDLTGRFTSINRAAEQLTGYGREEALKMNVAQIVAPEYLKMAMEMIRQKLEEGGRTTYELEIIARDGTRVPLEVSTRIIYQDGKPIGVQGIARDVSERKRAEETIRHLAYHDALTGLPNRALFKDRLTVALAQARRSGQMLAVMFLDLDRFKIVNDTVGHAEGDQLLCGVGEQLAGLLREGDTVARVGGDEFTLLLPSIDRVEDAVQIAERILDGLRGPQVLGGHEFHVTTSLGITIFPSDGNDAETLLRNADTAMYRAKEQGRNNYQLYTPAMNARVLERLALENSLRHALQRDEFVLHYQPQFDVRNGRIVGVEALLRWQHPQRGLVLPGEFIPLAEETGLILPLGEWVLRTACAQHKAWQATGLPPLRVAVNLSARQFLQSNLVQVVVRTLNESGLDPRYLELEITESVASQNADFAILVLRELRDMGVRISVDDFGAGYSSLSYLKDFPIHTLKIDRSFVRDLTTDPNDAAIASAIIALAHSLGLNVVAEGVETEEQLAFLKERQCDEFQGYLLARPMPAETLQKMLARNGRPQRRPAVKLAP